MKYSTERWYKHINHPFQTWCRRQIFNFSLHLYFVFVFTVLFVHIYSYVLQKVRPVPIRQTLSLKHTLPALRCPTMHCQRKTSILVIINITIIINNFETLPHHFETLHKLLRHIKGKNKSPKKRQWERRKRKRSIVQCTGKRNGGWRIEEKKWKNYHKYCKTTLSWLYGEWVGQVGSVSGLIR